jgi:uncharacterized protein
VSPARKPETVAVLGASPKPERYSHRAMLALKAQGHEVLPVSPRGGEIAGLAVFRSLGEIDASVDTLSVYVNPDRGEEMIDEIVRLRPGRVILNPGTESEILKEALQAAKIPVLEACTLVLLSTGQF